MASAIIAIITYKRPLWVGRLLESLINQKFRQSSNIKILVVDNGCDDKTKSTVEEIRKKSTIDILYETESIQGIVSARNKCVEIFLETNFENIIFIDDDEWPEDKYWAQTLLDKKSFYSADIATSHVVSVGEFGVPEWATKLIYGKNLYKDGDIVKVFYTNNLLLSRSVLQRIRPAFDLRFAKTGASDYHFALKCSKNGFKAVYVDAPVNEEFPKSRATIPWFIKRGFRSGVGFTRAHLYEENLFVAIGKSIFMSLLRFSRGIIYLSIGSFSFNKLKIVNGLFRVSSAIGTIFGLFGVRYNEYNKIHGK